VDNTWGFRCGRTRAPFSLSLTVIDTPANAWGNRGGNPVDFLWTVVHS
jgi:hypothetical protein